MNLDTTKVYYLGDLSDEQLEELVVSLRNRNNAAIFYLKNLSRIKKYIKNNEHLATNEYFKIWGLYSKDYYDREVVNALTLFEHKNERIAEIQLRIQELNNELIELDEEMRTLTYE